MVFVVFGLLAFARAETNFYWIGFGPTNYYSPEKPWTNYDNYATTLDWHEWWAWKAADYNFSQLWAAIGTNAPSSAGWANYYLTNGLTVQSNSWTSPLPPMTYGDNIYRSSNGVPHVIWKDEGGTVRTNRLVP